MTHRLSESYTYMEGSWAPGGGGGGRVTSVGVEVCPCARSTSFRSPGSAPAAAWRAGGQTPVWTTPEHLKKLKTMHITTVWITEAL